MSVLFRNNAFSRLSSSLSSSATTLSVSAGEGAKFPVPTGSDWFPVTIIKANGSLEIVRCSSRSGDVLTVSRGAEGTAAMTFSAGDRVELRLTAAALFEVFGGANTTYTTGAIELISGTPNIDFHYSNSAADFTSRIIAETATQLAIHSGSGRQITFRTGGTDVIGDITTTSNAIIRGGTVEIGDSVGGSSIQIRYDGSIASKPTGGSYGAFGTIWNSVNFDPNAKLDKSSVSAFMMTVLPSANAPAARTLLGVPTGIDKQMCKAWVNFNGTGTVSIRDSHNVSSITDNGVGDFTVNFATALQNANYSFSYTVGGSANLANMSSGAATAPTTTALRITSMSAAGAGAGLGFNATDFTYNSVQVFGG